jgi:nicotinamide mononucleotide (NMN) deamidase PncC
MARFSVTFIGMTPVGDLLAGGLAEAVGAPVTVAVFGLGCAGATAGIPVGTAEVAVDRERRSARRHFRARAAAAKVRRWRSRGAGADGFGSVRITARATRC